jgi:hypothetical protein
LLPWGKTPPKVNVSAIKSLRIFPPAERALNSLPEGIKNLTNLEKLQLGPTIDKGMVQTIRHENMPPNIRSLSIYGNGDPVTWPKETILPQVREFRTDFCMKFAKDNFPNLKILANKLDTKSSFLDVLDDYQDLNEIEFFSIPSNKVFSRLIKFPLRALGVLGGKLTSLDGVEDLKGLTSLRLNNLRHLKKISAIRFLGNLTELRILWCQHIQDIESILELKRLQKLQLFACRNIGFKNIEPQLRSRGLIELKISSTT